MAPPRLLTFSTLYPNAADPVHGVFVETRLRHLVASGLAQTTVIAPVPWFPSRAEVFGRYARLAAAPQRETRHGISVHHPRYLTVPKLGMNVAPLGLYAAARSLAREISRGEGIDVIDAHYFYPDGVAAAMIARDLGKPLAITARGTDINLLTRFAVPRRLILRAAARADIIIAVCQALREEIVKLGVPESKVVVLRNGVDLERFTPLDRGAARRELGLPEGGRIIASVGHLIERKGHDLIIRALAGLSDTHLLIVGSGPLGAKLRELASRLNLDRRVRFLGAVPQDRLRPIYSAADALVLASSREGWANVLLESMACGTPVVASNVWGTPEVVRSASVGQLIDARTPEAIAAGVMRLLASKPDRVSIRTYAEGFSWDETSREQGRIFGSLSAGRPR